MASKKVLPSRMALQQTKVKLKGAKKGHELLKKKSDALKKTFREVMLKIIDFKKRMGKEFNESMLALAEANFAAGDFGYNLADQVKPRSNLRLTISANNVAGVHLPKFVLRGEEQERADDKTMLGLTGGGKAITKCRDKFMSFLKLLTEIASYQTQFVTLDEVIKVTNRRVNGLEYVVIPRIQGNIKWIEKELDEMEREDFFRLKRVTDKKKEAKLQEQLAKSAAMDKADAQEGDEEAEKDDDDIFAQDEDEDVVF